MSNSNKRVQARTLKGFRDVLPAEALPKRRMMERLAYTFESYGFAPIETPHLEYTDVLINETGAEIGKQLFRFEDQGGRDVCMRYDLTVPFARFVVQHKSELGIPFKRYAFGNVFRGERPQFGRYREFTQCDFDMVGSRSMSADAEIVQILVNALYALDIQEFTVRLNNRELMDGVCEHLQIGDRVPAVLRALDKLDKIGVGEVKKELQAEEASLSADQATYILNFVQLSENQSGIELLETLRKQGIESISYQQGLENLEACYTILRAVGNVTERVKIDLTVARGFGYYTGIVYEVQLDRCPQVGTVASGGRYDNLTESYSSELLPGVGASVGLDRLLAGLTELGLLPDTAAPAPVLIGHMSKEESSAMHALANQLREQGIGVELYPEPGKLKKQFQYADKKGHTHVLLQGSIERERGVYLLKNLASGKQTEIPDFEALCDVLRIA